MPVAEGWKAKYGGLKVSEAKRLRELEEENRQLERLVAELTPATASCDCSGSAPHVRAIHYNLRQRRLCASCASIG